jgi:hypothetical protein
VTGLLSAVGAWRTGDDSLLRRSGHNGALLRQVLDAGWAGDASVLGHLVAEDGWVIRSNPVIHHALVWVGTYTIGWAWAAAESSQATYPLHALPEQWRQDRNFLGAVGRLLQAPAGRAGSDDVALADTRLVLNEHLGLPSVTAQVNGVPARMVVDTAASSCLVTPRLAERAAIRGEPQAVRRVGGGQAWATASPAVIDRLEVAGACAGGIVAAVVDLPPGLKLDGILALPAASRASPIELDLGAGRVEIGGRVAAVGQGAAALAAVTVDVRWAEGVPALAARVGGRPVWLSVDSGAMITVVTPELGLVGADQPAIGIAATGPVDLRPAGHHNVEVGGVAFNVDIAVREPPVDHLAVHRATGGLLGVPWLREAVVTVDPVRSLAVVRVAGTGPDR